jgi:hypothetical protein
VRIALAVDSKIELRVGIHHRVRRHRASASGQRVLQHLLARDAALVELNLFQAQEAKVGQLVFPLRGAVRVASRPEQVGCRGFKGLGFRVHDFGVYGFRLYGLEFRA